MAILDDEAVYRLLEAFVLAWYADARRNEQDLIDLAHWLRVDPEKLQSVIHKPRKKKAASLKR